MAAEPQTEGQKRAAYWIDQLGICDKWQRQYLTRAQRIVRRYKNQFSGNTGVYAADDDPALTDRNKRYALLWSNVETLKPAVYARTPVPVVTRRYRDPDPVGKVAADIIERALKFSIDCYDLDERIRLCRDDFLVPGRSQAWLRYIPHVGAVGSPENEEVEEETEGQVSNDVEAEGEADAIAYQEVVVDHVAYDDWGYQPCRNWSETGYVWRRAFLTRPELIARFGARLGKKIPLDWKPENDQTREGEGLEAHKGQIYEIWDKTSGKVYWISKGYPLEVLDERPDPLGLKGFFPCPRPLMATTPQDAYLPVPDFVYYQDQADQIDELTRRIGMLTNALRMVGVYAQEGDVDLANMFDGDQNTIIPIKSMASLQDKGGLKGIIEWLPIDMVVETLKGCVELRQQLLNDVYQITGLSDIIRGESDPNETATAQRLKGQWGSLRVRDKQKEIARFARDLLDMMGQLIASKFEVQTLKSMTEVKLLTQAEKQQIQQQQMLYQQAVQSSQQSGMPPPPPPPMPPGAEDLMSQPTWEEVMGLLRDKASLLFRVDIETNSTIEPDEAEAKASFNEFVQATTGLLTAAGPIVAGAPFTAPLFAEFMKMGARVYDVSPTLEDVIDKVFETAAQQPPAQGEAAPSGPTPEEMQLQAQEVTGQQQLEARGQDIEMARLQQDARYDQVDLSLRANEQRLKAEVLARDPTPQGTA